jgi:hypothetical protein
VATAKLGLSPPRLTQPLKQAAAAAGVKRAFDLPFRDTRRLADEQDFRFRPATENRAGNDAMTGFQAEAASP